MYSINGVRRKGIIKNGFIMIGRLNMIGLLILNSVGIVIVCMIDLVYFVFLIKNLVIIRLIVVLELLMEMNYWKNVFGVMWGVGILEVMVLVLLFRYCNYIGWVIDLIIEFLLILKNYKNMIKKVGINIFGNELLVLIRGDRFCWIILMMLILKIIDIRVIIFMIMKVGMIVLKDWLMDLGICLGILNVRLCL